MTIIATFIANAVLNFILGLLVARFLGPDEFGRYAIAFAVGLVINTALLDWLKLSASRFYSVRAREVAPEIRASLDLTVASLSLMFVAALAAFILAGVNLHLPASLVAGAAIMGIAGGMFDYHAALARALFRERTYAHIVILKNVAAFVLMVGGAYLYNSAVVVLAGFSLSVAVSLVLARLALAEPAASPRLAQRRLVIAFARYAVPLVVANVIYQLIPFANRSAVAAIYGFAEAGYLSLAADIGVRLFASAGSALDIFLFQLAVQKDELHGRAAAERQIARNVGIVLAVLVPSAAGYWLVLPAFEALIVPASFRGPFAAYTSILIPSLLAFGIIQYALNPFFQLARRTGPVIAAAAVALVVNIGLASMLRETYGPQAYAWSQLGGMLAGLGVALVLAFRTTRLAFLWRDLAVIAGATAAMTVMLLPLRGREPHELVLVATIVVGTGLYTAIIAAFDVAGLRASLWARMTRRHSRPVA